jgi:hypothetical protein
MLRKNFTSKQVIIGLIVTAVGVVLWLVVPTQKAKFIYPGSQAAVASPFGIVSKMQGDIIPKPDELPTTNGGLCVLLQSSAGDLSPHKVQAALDYLRNPQRAKTAMDPAAEYFNNIISLLLRQSEFNAELSKVLLGVVNDVSQALLLRDYAMQHFFHCWNRESNSETRRALEQALKSHSQDSKSPLQGVALLTTSRFFGQGKPVKGPNGEKLIPIGGTSAPDPLSISKPTSFTDAEFVTTALRVTTDLAATPAARASAFNVLLQMEVRQVINPARQVLHAATTPDDVRCSALAVLGTFGDVALDRSDLDAIPVLPEHVRRAADFALRKLFQSSQTKP